MWPEGTDLMREYKGKYGNETEGRAVLLRGMVCPYRTNTKLHRVFTFMQDGHWHSLQEITLHRYTLPAEYRVFHWRRARTASALRTIRAHPNLDVEYDGERYMMCLRSAFPPRS